MLSSSLRTKLNNGDSPERIVGLGTAIDKHVTCLKATYDFAVGGGAVADIVMKDQDGADAVIPSGAIITHVLIDVRTAVLSGGNATVAIKAEGAADLLGATAKASLTLNAFLDGVPVSSAATAVRLTADRTIKATVAVAALTAGKIDAYITYVL